MSIVQVFTAQGANGASAAVALPKAGNVSANLPAVDVTLFGTGTFGGGSLALEASPDGAVTWIPVAALTANGVISARLVATHIRANLTGATAPNLNAWAGLGGGVA